MYIYTISIKLLESRFQLNDVKNSFLRLSQVVFLTSNIILNATIFLSK